jgi:2-methylcitrate dehydratase
VHHYRRRVQAASRTKETADHGLYYALAAPLMEGTLSLHQYREELLHDHEIQMLLERTQFVGLLEYTKAYYAQQAQREFPSSALVTLKNGRTAEDMRHVPLGHPKNPMSDLQIEAKFRQFEGALGGDGRPLLDALWNVDKLDDVSKIIPLTKLDLGAEG